MGIPKKVVGFKKRYIKPFIAFMFLLGGLMIYLAAEPFYNSALVLATSFGISSFLFIQWIAPFLSEFPEKTSAFYWASKVNKASMALMNLISSKLTQWTLLLAMIPVVFSFSAGSISSIPLSSVIIGTSFTISTEFLLTIASSFYASTLLMKLRFTCVEASSLLILFIIQFVWVTLRPVILWVYFGLAVLEIIIYYKEITKVFSAFKRIFMLHVKR